MSYVRRAASIRWEGKAFDDNIKSYNHLIEIARSVVSQFYEYISGSGFIIALSNTEGVLLEILGDPEVIERGIATTLWLEPIGQSLVRGSSRQD